MNQQNYLISLIEKGVQNQLQSFNQNKTRITYHVQPAFTTNYIHPEEQIRAACFCELVSKYKYPVD